MAARKLWLVEWPEWEGYDVYTSFVVCCQTEEEARNTHPGDNAERRRYGFDLRWDGLEWITKEDVAKLVVTPLGVAYSETHSGVHHSSMRHG